MLVWCTCQKIDSLQRRNHALVQNFLQWNGELWIATMLATTFVMDVCLSLIAPMIHADKVTSLFPVRWVTVLISLTLCPTHTHTFGGRSPAAFLVACPVGWHGSFKWHIVASEAMLIGHKLQPDQTSYICSLSHTHNPAVSMKTWPICVTKGKEASPTFPLSCVFIRKRWHNDKT